MKKLCPGLYSISIRFISVVFVATGFFFVNSSPIQAQEIGTHVEFRTEWDGATSVLGAQSDERMVVTAVIALKNIGRAQKIVNELKSSFTDVVIRVSGSANENGPGFIAITPAEATTIGLALKNIVGIHAIEFGNEINNTKAEWVGGDTQSYIDAYNAFDRAIGSSQRIGPAALDPFFANDALEVAGEINRGIFRADVLFFNAYESRSEDAWSRDNGCGFTEWNGSPGMRDTGCSWRLVAAMYNRFPRREKILTEFSLKPPDNDRDLAQVLRYISTVGPTMDDITIITPLVRDVCNVAKSDWLYLVRRSADPQVNGFGLVTENGTTVNPADCGTSSGVDTGQSIVSWGGFGNLVSNIKQFVLSSLVSKECDPLADVLSEYDGPIRVDTTGRSFGVPCLRDIMNNEVTRHTNVCRNFVSDTVLIDPLNPQPVLWRPQEVFNSYFASFERNGSVFSDIYNNLENSTKATPDTRKLNEKDRIRKIQNEYLSGPWKDLEIAEKAQEGPQYEKLKFCGLINCTTPFTRPVDVVDFDTDLKTLYVNKALTGIGWSFRTNQDYGMKETDLFKNFNADQAAGHDIVACYINSKGQRVIDTSEDPADQPSLPIRLSYFACRTIGFSLDTNFLNENSKKAMCDKLYGKQISVSGKIAPGSIYGAVMTPAQRNYTIPSPQVLYQSGSLGRRGGNSKVSCWDMIRIPNDERATVVKTEIIAKPWDPSYGIDAETKYETFYSDPIRHEKDAYELLGGSNLPYRVREHVKDEINKTYSDQQCSNAPYDDFNAFKKGYGDVVVRSARPEDIGAPPLPQFRGLYCPGGNCPAANAGAAPTTATTTSNAASAVANTAPASGFGLIQAGQCKVGKLRANTRVAFLGDSMTNALFGSGDAGDLNQDSLAQKLGVAKDNIRTYATSGKPMDYAVANKKHIGAINYLNENPSADRILVVESYAYNGYDAESLDDIRRAVATANPGGIRIVFVATLATHDTVIQKRIDDFKAKVNEFGGTLVDVATASGASGEYVSSDGIHPSAAGEHLIVNNLINTLISGGSSCISSDVQGVSTQLVQAGPILIDANDVTNPISLAPEALPVSRPALEATSDRRDATITYEYSIDEVVASEYGERLWLSLMPFQYTKVWNQALSGGLALRDSFCVGNQELSKDLDDQSRDKPFPGCGTKLLTSFIKCMVAPFPYSNTCRQLLFGTSPTPSVADQCEVPDFSEGTRVAFLGDSMTAGLFERADGALFAERLGSGITTDNLGNFTTGGTNMETAIKTLGKHTEAITWLNQTPSADRILVVESYAYNGYSSESLQLIKDAVRDARPGGIRIVYLATIAPCDPDQYDECTYNYVHDEIKRFKEDADGSIADAYTASGGLPYGDRIYIAPDGLHPSDKFGGGSDGVKLITNALREKLSGDLVCAELDTGPGSNPSSTAVRPPGPGTTLDYTIPFRNTSCNVSPSAVQDVANVIGRSNPYFGLGSEDGSANLINEWINVVNGAKKSGVNPIFALTLWVEESAASGIDKAAGMGCISIKPTLDANGNTTDVHGDVLKQLRCLSGSINADKQRDFLGFMCRWSGEPSRDRGGTERCTEFTNNRNFPKNVKYWYDQFAQGQPEICQSQRAQSLPSGIHIP